MQYVLGIPDFNTILLQVRHLNHVPLAEVSLLRFHSLLLQGQHLEVGAMQIVDLLLLEEGFL